MAVTFLFPLISNEIEGYETDFGRLGYTFLMADATSKRAAAMSVFLSNETFTFPEPFREVEDVPEQPFRLESTPSSLEVTSDSTTSEVAPFIL